MRALGRTVAVVGVCSAAMLVPTAVVSGDKEDCGSSNYAVAISACTRLLRGGFSQKKDHAETLYSRAYAYSRIYDYEAAIKDYSDALRIYPPYSNYYYDWRADAYEASGQFQRAIEDRNALIKLAPSKPGYISGRGRLYQRIGDWDRALQDYAHVIQLEPNSASSYQGRALYYYAKGDFAKAVDDYAQAIRLEPTSGYWFVNRAEALLSVSSLAS